MLLVSEPVIGWFCDHFCVRFGCVLRCEHSLVLDIEHNAEPTTQACVYFNPKRIAITAGYHGCHATIDVFKRSRNGNLPIIGIDDEFQPGDLCWLETPLNPTGEAR